MASSRIEMASSPYSNVLRDHNQRVRHRDRERGSNSRAQAAFQKNLKELVRDNLHTCIVLSAPRDTDAVVDENSQHRIENRDCWTSDEERNGRNFRSTSSREETMVESSAMRRRHTRILDRWAARQAREMITTIERQTHEAEILVLSNSQPVSTRSPTFLRENSPAPSDSSADLPNMRASSLVQMWREFEAEARLPTRNQSGSVNSNSAMSNIDTASVEEHSVGSEVCDSVDERHEALAIPEDSFPYWESDQTAPSNPLPSYVGDNERVRVADIIRRLYSGNGRQSVMTSWSDEIDREQPIVIDQSQSEQGEQRDFPFIGNPPRVRGRQAIMDLLMQMERERQRELSRLVERRAVSQFSQRGRIQSLLRLRFLQREVAIQNQRRPASTASELDELQQRTTIFFLRERFNQRVERDVRAVLSGEDNLRRSHTQLPNNTLDSEHSGLSDQLMSEDIHHEEVDTNEQENTSYVNHSLPSTSGDLQEEARQISDVTQQGTSLVVSNLDWQGHVDTATTSQSWEVDVATEEPDPDTPQHVESVDGWEGVTVTEEPDHVTQQLVGSNDGTWLSDVSHPRRDWESHRQAWYHDILENNSDNVEIRELLERRSVSTSLASGFRGRMEQLIFSYLQRQRHQAVGESAEEEVENPIEHQYHEVSDDSDQMAPTSLQLPLPPRLRSRNRYQNHEVSDEFDQVASTSLQLPPPSQSYYQDNQQRSPFINHSSLEMELIYDLRGHMEQLHQEMSELRESIASCMDMQVKLQHSIKQEVSAAVCHSVRGGEVKEFSSGGPMRKGSCCICYEMQIDSLLYRCGHMCTCFKCAHELQWSSGRCPICRAPIVDVVRTYSDS